MTGIERCLHFWRHFEVQINAGEKKEGKEDAPSTAAPAPGTGKAVDFAKISIEEAFTTLKVQWTASAQSANFLQIFCKSLPPLPGPPIR